LKNNQKLESGKAGAAYGTEVPALKTYRKPELKEFGMMQKITLGGSVGTGDSGGAQNTKPPQ